MRLLALILLVSCTRAPTFTVRETPATLELRSSSDGAQTVMASYQGKVDPRRPTYLYYDAVAMLPQLVGTHPHRSLMLGVGAGAMAWHYGESGLELDGVELSGDALRLGRERFELDRAPFHLLVQGDACEWVKEASTYDSIVVDLFDGSHVVPCALSKDFWRAVHTHLTPDGVALWNVYGDPAPAIHRLRDTFAFCASMELPHDTWLLLGSDKPLTGRLQWVALPRLPHVENWAHEAKPL